MAMSQGDVVNKDAYQEDVCLPSRIVNDVEDVDEEPELGDLGVDHILELERIEKWIGPQLRRELDAAKEQARNLQEEELEQLQANGRGGEASISDVDSNIDYIYFYYSWICSYLCIVSSSTKLSFVFTSLKKLVIDERTIRSEIWYLATK